MFSPDEIDRLSSLFSKFTQPDNDAISAAENELDQLIQSDFIQFIINCSAIIMDERFEKNIVFFAIQNIARVLSTQNIPLILARKKWIDVDEEAQEYIKTAVFRGMMFQEENITNMASKALCILAIVEKEAFFPVIEQIVSLIVDEESNEYDKDESEKYAISSLYFLNEISSPPYYPNYINDIPNLGEMMAQTNEKIFEIFANQALIKSDKYKENIVSVINSFILHFSPLYQDGSISETIVPVIQQYLSSNPTDELFDLLCQILLNLTTINYGNKDFNFSIISELAVDLVMSQENPAQFSSSVNFWNYLSKFEFDLLQKDIKCLNLYSYKSSMECLKLTQPSKVKFPVPDPFLNYTSAAPAELLDKLLSTFTLADPDDTSAEPKESETEPYEFASVCLNNIFKLNHQAVFDAVQKFWNDIYSEYNPNSNDPNYNLLLDEKVPWTVKNALILSITTICSNLENDRYRNPAYNSKVIEKELLDLLKNSEYDPDIKNSIISFITDESISPNFHIFSDFILQAVYSPIPLVVDTALYSIKMLVQHYSLGIEVDDPSTATFSFLMEAFKKIMNETQYDEAIFKRILYVLSIFFDKFGRNGNYSLVIQYKDDILSIISFGLSAPNNSYDVYMLTNRALGNLIRYTPDESLELVFQILENSMNELTELMKFEVDDMTIIKQQQMLNIVILIFKRKRLPIKDDLLIDASSMIFNIMEAKTPVFEDALCCLMIIIIKLNDISDQLIEKVLSVIPDALSSQSPSIIQMTAITISHLYKESASNCVGASHKIEKTLPQNLVDTLPEIVDLIMSFLDDETYSNEFHSILLVSLANILKAARKYIPFDKAEEFYKMYKKFIPVANDLFNQSEIELANDMFEAILAGFSAILKIYCCLDEETQDHLRTRKNYREFINLITNNYLNLDEFTDGSLKNYCKFLISVYHFFGPMSRIILNRASNFIPLCYACISNNKDLSQKGKITVDRISNA